MISSRPTEIKECAISNVQHAHPSLARAAQQGAVGGILNQRVFEQVFCLRRDPALEDETGIDEALEGVLQCGLVELSGPHTEHRTTVVRHFETPGPVSSDDRDAPKPVTNPKRQLSGSAAVARSLR